jgi:hypothetical protein
MIRLTFVPPSDDAGWDAWLAEAELAKTQLLQTPPEQRKIKDRLYKGARRFLLAATHKKCAYCETHLPPQERTGDVEHYRPKGRVRDRHGKIVMVQQVGGDTPHPGYFWLAYDYRNLLPVCGACNRRARDAREGRLTGKGDIFPMLDDWYAGDPDGISDEKPSLLNPWLARDDPSGHLSFDPKTGLVMGRTDRGRQTIELLGLNRDGLPEERQEACVRVRERIHAGLAALGSGVDSPSFQALKQAVKDGSVEYSAICRIQFDQTMVSILKFCSG